MSWSAVKTSNMSNVLKLTSRDSSVCRRRCQPAWVELRQTSLLRCNFPCNRFVSLWILGANWTYERGRQQMKEVANQSKNRVGSWFFRSLLDFQTLATPDLTHQASYTRVKMLQFQFQYWSWVLVRQLRNTKMSLNPIFLLEKCFVKKKARLALAWVSMAFSSASFYLL